MLLSASAFLAKLAPTSRILALTTRGGLALSDPYLSCAMPLPDAVAAEVAREHDVGGLLLLGGAALPEGRLDALHTLHTPRVTLSSAVARADAEHPFWDEIDLSRWGEPDIDAAVGLHDWLWEHVGGWSNTFG